MDNFLNRALRAQGNASDSLNRAMGNEAMEGPMCCFCIPIKAGITLIGIYSIFDTMGTVAQAMQMQEVSTIVFIFYTVALIPCFLCVYIFGKYWIQNDSR